LSKSITKGEIDGPLSLLAKRVATIRSESDYSIGFHVLQMSHDIRDSHGRPGLIQLTIQVFQEVDLVNTKQLGRCLQSSLAYLAQGPCSWILLFAP